MINSIFVLEGNKVKNITSAQLQSLKSKGFVWVDIEAPSEEDFEHLKNIFPLHPLACEASVRKNSRPRVTEFDEHLFVVFHEPFKGGKHVSFLQLDLFIGTNFLITTHSKSLVSIDTIKKNFEENPKLFKKGPSFIAYYLLDHIVDNYFPIMDDIDKMLDDVEDEVFINGSDGVLNNIFSLRRYVLELRKKVVPEREVLSTLARFDSKFIDQASTIYFRDIYDHTIRISEMVDAYRDLLTSVLDVYLSAQSKKLNEVMKVLTVIATIMMPLTLITGFYGMNINFPEVQAFGVNSYWFILGIMLVIAFAMVVYFKKKKWW